MLADPGRPGIFPGAPTYTLGEAETGRWAGLARWWTNLFDKVWDHILIEEPAVKESADLEAPAHMLQAVEQARREWVTARLYFESVTDPDLVDHAIYSIEAAERKYMYLLRQARAQGLAVPSAEGDPPAEKRSADRLASRGEAGGQAGTNHRAAGQGQGAGGKAAGPS